MTLLEVGMLLELDEAALAALMTHPEFPKLIGLGFNDEPEVDPDAILAFARRRNVYELADEIASQQQHRRKRRR